MTDILVKNLTVVTMDAERRVIEDASIAISGERIDAVGSAEIVAGRFPNAEVQIDGRGFIAIPGLIDCHSHAGHGLVRALGAGDGKAWFEACRAIYAYGSTPDFWRAEARLTQLERLKAGVTTAVTLLGGGDDVMRTDDARAGDAHCGATVESGLRTMLAVGPNRLPFPIDYRVYEPDGAVRDISLSFDRQLEVCDELIGRWNDLTERRTGICLTMPVYDKNSVDSARRTEIQAMCRDVVSLRESRDVLFTQDGHRSGSIAVARDLRLLGPHALLSHSVDLTPEDIAALKETGARVVHNPASVMSIYGRCPVPELLDEGVTVCIGSDASAPDRGYDLFRLMSQCMHYHRRHFMDASYLPPGKVLEMVTIDSANALGLGEILGSLEAGRKADIVLLDRRKPHLFPSRMPVTQIAHFANAADVDTVIVNGKVLMRNRVPLLVDEDSILDEAERESALALERTGLAHLAIEPEDYWGRSRRRVGYPI